MFLESVIQNFGTRFSLKDRIFAFFFLGIEVIPTPASFLSQYKYISDILSKASVEAAKEVTTPQSTSEFLILNDGFANIDSTKYCRAVF